MACLAVTVVCRAICVTRIAWSGLRCEACADKNESTVAEIAFPGERLFKDFAFWQYFSETLESLVCDAGATEV